MDPIGTQASFTADASNFHGKPVDIGAKVLGTCPSLTPRRFRSLASSPHPVSIPSIPAIIHLLTCYFLICSEDPAWKRLISHTLTTDERISLIRVIFSDGSQIKVVRNLSGDDAQNFIDVIDNVSAWTLSLLGDGSADSHSTLHPVNQALGDVESQTRMRCLRFLYRICGRLAVLPRSLAISPDFNRMESPVASGGFADVWKGYYQDQEVAVKVLKVYSGDGSEKIRGVRCP